MAGDPSCPPRWAAGKEPADLSRPYISQLPILFGSPLTIPGSSPCSGVFISQTKSLGVGQRSFLDEDTLALVSLARTAEAHDNRAETTRFLRSLAPSRRYVHASKPRSRIEETSRYRPEPPVVKRTCRAAAPPPWQTSRGARAWSGTPGPLRTAKGVDGAGRDGGAG